MYSDQSFINREISWLSFNERVLQEAADPNTPLLERIRFIGIFSNNLDEFFRVRVAAVRRMVDFGKDEENLLGQLTPKELHDKIQAVVIGHQQKVQTIYKNILDELKKDNIFLIDEKELNHQQGIFVKKYFYDKVLPNLVPIMLRKNYKFPYLRDRSVYLAVKLSKKLNPQDFAYSLIRIPSLSVSRFLVLPKSNGNKIVMMLDDVIRYCLNDLFFYFDHDVYEAFTLKITRDAELDIDDDISKSFMEKMSHSLKKRKTGKPVRLIYDRTMPEDLKNFIFKKMKLNPENAIPGGKYHNHKDFMNFPEIGKKKHYYTKLTPFRHKDLLPNTSILQVLRKKDVMLHYPYQTFNHFIDLLREAAIDPQVKEIGITIYRVAGASKVVNALLNAVRNGKIVTVVIELQARFDEEANIFWSNKLQEEGANVINGVPGIKVHSKLAWIKRKEGNIFRNYAYIGTGNFHEGTARVYADDGLMTSDPRLANEVSNAFEFFKHNYMHFDYEHLIISPFKMRKFFTKRIDHEVELAKSGKNAYMIVKMNSLIDPEMMKKITDAGKAGVKIQLIVRGIFGLNLSPELSKNITAISIVDKYLEHSRIFLFGNDGDEKIYISSADWMPRNLNRRFEVACPVYNKEIQAELKEMLNIQLKDNSKARILEPELLNKYNPGEEGDEQIYRAQEDYYKYIKQKHHVVMKIYHNPRCSKSRAGLEYLEEKGYDLEIKKYLVDGLSETELKEIVAKSGKQPFFFVRTHEKDYIDNYKGKEFTDDEWIKILVENPKLLQRPIVIKGEKAVLANPPEKIEEIL